MHSQICCYLLLVLFHICESFHANYEDEFKLCSKFSFLLVILPNIHCMIYEGHATINANCLQHRFLTLKLPRKWQQVELKHVTGGLDDLLRKISARKYMQEMVDSPGSLMRELLIKGKKLMDLLLCFISDRKAVAVIKYVASFFFGHVNGEDLYKHLKKFHFGQTFWYSKEYNRFLSSRGAAINKEQYNILNGALSKFKLGPLFSFVLCTLHTIHKAFSKSIAALTLDQLMFDLYSWFKRQPCKRDFQLLAKGCDLPPCCEPLFLKHVNSHWLMLTPALKHILERWQGAKNYFLVFLTNDTRGKDLAKNDRYIRIVKVLKEHKIWISIFHQMSASTGLSCPSENEILNGYFWYVYQLPIHLPCVNFLLNWLPYLYCNINPWYGKYSIKVYWEMYCIHQVKVDKNECTIFFNNQAEISQHLKNLLCYVLEKCFC